MGLQCGTFEPIVGFACTGSDESHIWKQLHGTLLDDFHCGTCQKHAQKLFNGIHSLVSLGIGKKLIKQEYIDALLLLQTEINLVVHQAQKDGRM